MSEYNAGGVIPGEPVPVRIEVGERVITSDGTVYELQYATEGCPRCSIVRAYRWVEIGAGFALWMGQADDA